MTGPGLVSLSIAEGAPETEGQLKILLARRANAARAGSRKTVDRLLLCSEVTQESLKDLHSAELIYGAGTIVYRRSLKFRRTILFRHH